MMSRLLLSRASVALCRSAVGPSVVQKGSFLMAPRAPVFIAQRPLVLVVTGMDELEEEEEEMWDDFEENVEVMGAEDNPFLKKEHLKGKERRYMRRNALVGKRANHKVRALIDVIHFKRRSKMQH